MKSNYNLNSPTLLLHIFLLAGMTAFTGALGPQLKAQVSNSEITLHSDSINSISNKTLINPDFSSRGSVAYGVNNITKELYNIDMDDPTNPTLVTTITPEAFAADFTATDPNHMWMIDSRDHALKKVNISTGAVVHGVHLGIPWHFIPDQRYCDWNMLAIHKKTGTFYGVVESLFESKLYEINPENGNLTKLIDFPRPIKARAGVFDNTGTLYMLITGILGHGGQIIKVDFTTNSYNIIGYQQLFYGWYVDMGYDSQNDIIYLAHNEWEPYPSNTKLRSVDRNTGLTTLIAELPYRIAHFAFPYVYPIDYYDWGDAPDDLSTSIYPTYAINNGASHIVDQAICLGATIDGEEDGQPGPAAVGDDNLPTPTDEDGVRFISSLVPGELAFVEVVASVMGFLNAWIDFDKSNGWVGEQIFGDILIYPGASTLSFYVPESAQIGTTFARFRFNTDGGLSYNGPAINGEVEDYLIEIVDKPDESITQRLQLPDLTTDGVDVYCMNDVVLADDFRCTETAYITDIHIWGSWLLDDVPIDLPEIVIGFWTDNPSGQNGHSEPLELRWEHTFEAGTYAMEPYVEAEDGEWFYKPHLESAEFPGDFQVWKLNFYIPEEEAFIQHWDSIYWLSVNVQTETGFMGEIGWKSSCYPYNNYAVWQIDQPTWELLDYPSQHHLADEYMDLAFYVSGDPVTPPECEYTIELYDDYGDGWNNCFLDVYVDGNLVLNGITIINGYGPQTEVFTAYTGLPIQFDYTPGGYPYETSYFVYNNYGNLVFQDGVGGIDPTGGTIVGDCGEDIDFGDAPDDEMNPGYPTLTINNGASHIIVPEVFLGFAVDAETDGQPGFAAEGDDNKPAPSDEDGVRFMSSLAPGEPATIEIMASTNGFINAWIDFDNDMDWTGEQIFTDKQVFAGSNTLTFDLPSSASIGTTISRFRYTTYSTGGSLGFTGPAINGEVEDQLIEIVDSADQCKMHYPQWPEITTDGVDVYCMENIILADDFLCEESGKITDIHIWGSWYYDIVPQQFPPIFHLGIWSDDPGVQDDYSKPDELLWEYSFYPGDYTMGEYAWVEDGEWFYWPHTSDAEFPGDWSVMKLNFPIPEDEICVQDSGSIYWLSVNAFDEYGNDLKFGWKSSPYHFNDNAVLQVDPPAWNMLCYPPLHPLSNACMDLAFYISGEKVTKEDCTYTIELYDDYGDGWDYCTLDVYVDGELVHDGLSIINGYGPQTEYFTVTTGSLVELVYTAGEWPEENYYYVYDAFGNFVFSDGIGGIEPMGGNITGECDDGLDFGDAPDLELSPQYPSLLTNNGARHIIDPTIIMGNLIDAEAEGLQTSDALGDNNTDLDDEDGVTFVEPFVVGEPATVKVVVSADGYLNAWLDFNKDSIWNASEHIIPDMPVTAGLNAFTFNIPAGTQPGSFFARFRYNTSGGLMPFGIALDGEVEDYKLIIFPPGWGFTPTDSIHLILVSSVSSLNCIPIVQGDFISTWFTDENNDLACGGAAFWDGVSNEVVIAYGDDPTTPGIKDGFDGNEDFLWKAYYSSTSTEQVVEVGYVAYMPDSDGKFHDGGLSALTYLTNPITITAFAELSTVCEGDPVQLDAMVSGGCGTISYSWTSNPAGFVSNIMNPIDNPTETTTYFVIADDGYSSAMDQVTVTVTQIPDLICPDELIVCIDDPPITLSQATPPGGIYSGPGVSGGIFYPSVAGVGNHIITYYYIVSGTDCEATYTFFIEVNSLPGVNCPVTKHACDGDPLVMLTGSTPPGGEYTGPDVTFDGTYYWFDPSTGSGTYAIEYCYTDPNTNCENCCGFDFVVWPLPEPDCPSNMVVCENDGSFNLSGASPTGGIYSGTGVSSNKFYPEVAGPGIYTIIYCWTNQQTQCEGCCEFEIEVIDVPDVSCPGNMEVCIDEPPFQISGVTPVGGDYSGAGMSGSIFSPIAAGAGLHTITYTYVVPGTNCNDFCTFNILVHDVTDVVCPPTQYACDGDPMELLTGSNPSGGEYSGPGVSFAGANYWFDPTIGSGTHAIEYCYTDPASDCENCCVFDFVVWPVPEPVCPSNMVVCENDGSFNLSGASPTGGIYSGTGVSGNKFYPDVAGPGTYTITYCWTNQQTQCEGCCEFEIEVIDVPDVSCPGNMEVCVDEPPFTISGTSPNGGVYSGAGMSGSIFSPIAAGAGLHTITYTYVVPGTNCNDFCTFNILVHDVPDVVCPPTQYACDGDPKVILAGGNPSGGEYSGTGVNFDGANYWFDPSTGSGTHAIEYCYSDPASGCENCCVFDFVVWPVPEPDCPDDMMVCENEGSFDLSDATPTGGIYSGTGVSGNKFYPDVAGPGTYTITYCWTNQQTLCEGCCEFEIEVIDVPDVSCPGNMEVCIDEPPITISGAIPNGGVFTGAGMSGSIFSPIAAGTGLHTITYTYVVQGTNCNNFCTFNILVHDIPDVVCPPTQYACDGDPKVILAGGNPPGGEYSGPGVSFDDANFWFDPSIGYGTYTLEYCYYDQQTGCSDCCTFDFVVSPIPAVTCPDDQIVCTDTEPFDLTGANPGGGTYTGPGVSGNKFYPATAGVGEHSITYCWTNQQTQCENCCTYKITVIYIPEIQCPDDLSVCLNDAPFPLTGGNPTGGTYAGPEVTNGIFDPLAAGVGIHTITYTIGVQGTNCFVACEFKVSVENDQLIEVVPGWQGISSYIVPSDPDVVNLTSAISSELIILFQYPDKFYYPAMGINTLGIWDAYKGYILKSDGDTDPSVCGNEVYPKELSLVQGWQVIPVLTNYPVDVEVLFTGLGGLIIVKDVAGGNVYWKDYGINTIGHLMPGAAYFVNMSSESVLTFPEQTDNALIVKPFEHNHVTSPWNQVIHTPSSHTVVFNLNGSFIEPGDIIGGFSPTGLCAGLVEVAKPDRPFVISLNADDQYTPETNGFKVDEHISYKLYHSAIGKTVELKTIYNPEMNIGYFEFNGMSEVISLMISFTGYSEYVLGAIRIFPNPSPGIFNIEGSNEDVDIRIYNALSDEIFHNEMKLPQKIDLSAQPNGVYFILICTNGGVHFEKLVIK